MTDQGGSDDPGMGDADPPTVPLAATPGSMPGDDDANEVRHSLLVGYMSVPLTRRFPIRRSTFLMAVVFIGLSVLLYFNPPNATATGTGAVVRTADGDYFLPGAVKVAPSTTTTTSTTSTTSTTTTTTRPQSTTTTTARPESTTTTRPLSTTTTTYPLSATTTTSGGSTTTTSARGVGATGSTTTTTTAAP